MSAFVDVTGHRFGRLIAIQVVGKYVHGKNTSMIWECQCDCGNVVRVTKSSLGRSTNSCGCLGIETRRETGRKNKGLRSLPSGIAAKNKLFDKYKRGAMGRGLDFGLSLSEFESLTQGVCYYCGIEPKQTTKEAYMNGQYTYNGIDRVNNSIGYTLDNCVPCCGTCNKAKLKMSKEEFAEWIWRVYRNFAVYQPITFDLEELDIRER